MNSKAVLFFAISLGVLLPNFARSAGESQGIAVKIDIPELWGNGKMVYPRRLENRYPDYDQFSVVIENVSSKALLLSGGDWMNLSFEVTDENGKKSVIHHVAEMDSGKPPADLRLEPGEATVRVIHYAAMKYGQSSEWESFPFPHDPHRTGGVRKVTLRAVYEQARPAQSAESDYWTGTAISKPYEVLLEDNALQYTGPRGDSVTDGVDMSLSVLMTNRETEFEIGFKNVGQRDVSLNLGMMLANGKVQLPDKIHLKIKDDSGRTRELHLDTSVAGRVDDYVVPLRVGSTYTVKVPLKQMWSDDVKDDKPERELKPGRYEVSVDFEGTGAESANGDMEGIKLMNFWRGKAGLTIVTVIQ